jgi:hypothetical protein
VRLSLFDSPGLTHFAEVFASVVANSEVAQGFSFGVFCAQAPLCAAARSIFPHELPNDNQNGDKGNYRRYETKQR